jgi:hypothetical protein
VWIVPVAPQAHQEDVWTEYVIDKHFKTPTMQGATIQGKDVESVKTWMNAFSLSFEFKFDEFYFMPSGKGKRLGFFANSGVKIWGIHEIQIFDTKTMFATIGYNNIKVKEKFDDHTNRKYNRYEVSATGYESDYIDQLITSISYGERNGLTTKNELDFAATILRSLDTNDGWNSMVIEFRPTYNGNAFVNASLKVSFNGYAATNTIITHGTGDGNRIKLLQNVPDAERKVFIQAHWGSGVEFRNVLINNI